jgi:hypothetical protein
MAEAGQGNRMGGVKVNDCACLGPFLIDRQMEEGLLRRRIAGEMDAFGGIWLIR